MKLLLFALLGLLLAIAPGAFASAPVCYGDVLSPCARVDTTVPLPPSGPLALPGGFLVGQAGRSTLTVNLQRGTFADAPVVDSGEIIGGGQGASYLVATGDDGFAVFGLTVADPDLAVADRVTAQVMLVNPNGAAAVLYDQRLTLARIGGIESYTVPLFNPASNTGNQSLVRLINSSDVDGLVHINGIDDSGNPAGPAVLAIAAGNAALLNATDLEVGAASKGLTGSLGDGNGRWRLTLDSDFDGLTVQALVRNAVDGTLSTVSDVVRE